MSLDRARQLIHGQINRDDPIGSLIHVLEAAIELISLPGNDFCWSSWEDEDQAKAELLGLVSVLRSGGLPKKLDVSVLFAVTGPLQELSLSSGWADTFLKVADKYDEVEALLW
ncbi:MULTISPECIES: hypothetical protein [unclassified Pseudomonas]|uniref:hypothetical protein n=1 Tax=unclassified Pseudomonas TaxID=196821 RepID=UPI001F58925A|nr:MULTISPECIES: hypothetical protein [unclassified Pseudomonas]